MRGEVRHPFVSLHLREWTSLDLQGGIGPNSTSNVVSGSGGVICTLCEATNRRVILVHSYPDSFVLYTSIQSHGTSTVLYSTWIHSQWICLTNGLMMMLL
jgi:hypothetical protein